jgi:hypothetical protein
MMSDFIPDFVDIPWEGWAMSNLEDTLRRNRETDQSQVGTWLLTQFQQKM